MSHGESISQSGGIEWSVDTRGTNSNDKRKTTHPQKKKNSCLSKAEVNNARDEFSVDMFNVACSKTFPSRTYRLEPVFFVVSSLETLREAKNTEKFLPVAGPSDENYFPFRRVIPLLISAQINSRPVEIWLRNDRQARTRYQRQGTRTRESNK